MCGIAGILRFDGRDADPQLVERMVASIRHRGPDGAGVHVNGPAGLGHARLSIIDLEGGAQPMSTQDGSLWITFNGEIFNYIELREELIRKGHRFATRSDTEVILHLYRDEGEECVRKLNGQWAFAIWDQNTRRLFLSRDRVGVRPLYYTADSRRFLFGSEIKALLASGDVETGLDLRALDQILTFWVVLPPRTAFRDIQQLPPGHSLTIENGRMRLQRHWQLNLAPEEEARWDFREKADELLSLLSDAARIRLRADVPVGAYLSGGLDSTVIAALAKRHAGKRLRTFSVAFRRAEFDESQHQRHASEFLGTEHQTIHCGDKEIREAFPRVVRHAEQPIIRTAPAPMMLLAELVRSSGFKVVLTGEGADEFLGGYDIFKETKIREFWARRPDSRWRPLLLQRLYPYMEGIQRQPQAYLEQFFKVAPGGPDDPFFSHLPRWQMTAGLKNLLSAEARAEIGESRAMEEMARSLPARHASARAFSRAEQLEAEHLLPGYILSSQGDRVAMAHAVEGRYPFLDHRVIEFASRLPIRMKMKALDQKHLLKRAADGLVPSAILQRKKQPYRAPDGACFFGDSNGYAAEMLSEKKIRNTGVFDPKAVEALARKFREGRPTSTRDNMALVAVLSTQILMEDFLDGRLPAGA